MYYKSYDVIIETPNRDEVYNFYDPGRIKRYSLTADNKEKDRVLRTIRFMTWGLMFGVLGHFYLMLSNYLVPGKKFADIVKKLIIDQLVWSPCVNCVFFFVISFLECPGKQPTAGLQSIKKNIWPTQKINVFIWVPVQCINFLFVRPSFQLVIINIVSLFWNCYLSIVANRTPDYTTIKSDDSEV